MSDTPQAINTIQSALLSDEEYRQTWVANIAMAIHDTRREPGEGLHAWRQRCAETFLRYLTAGHEDDPTSKAMEDLPGVAGIQGYPV